MTTAADFKLHSVQAVMFTPLPGSQFRTSRVVASVLRGFANRYDGDVQSGSQIGKRTAIQVSPTHKGMFRLQIGAPDVVMTSFDGRWLFESSPVRSDSHWVAQDDSDSSRSLAEVTNECLGPLLKFPVENGVPVGRVALVVHRIHKMENPAIHVVEKFCRQDLADGQPLRNSRAFRIENLKKYRSARIGLDVNSWFKCYGGETDDIVEPSIIIEQDINTLVEVAETATLEEEQIRNFFAGSASELDEIFRLYFP